MREFLEQLIIESWVTNGDDVVAFAQDLEPVFVERLTLSVLSRLPEAYQWEALALIENDNDAFLPYCEERIDNFDDRMQEVVDQFADEYLAAVADEA